MRQRQNPRISVNKLADYLTTNSVRRRSIVKDQKKPKVFMQAYYNEAEKVIIDFLFNSNRNTRLINQGISRIRAFSDSSWDVQRKKNCIEVLRHFKNMTKNLCLAECETIRAGNLQPTITISGVEISIRPEIIIKFADKRGNPCYGAYKLYLSKSTGLTKVGSEYIGTLLYETLKCNYLSLGKPKVDSCYILDIFSEEIFISPKNYRRRYNEIEAACQEICALWNVR